jgi:hypothetical protein
MIGEAAAFPDYHRSIPNALISEKQNILRMRIQAVIHMPSDTVCFSIFC